MSRDGERVGGALWVRALERLLVLYPPSFRRAMGREMVSVFARELRRRRARGRVATIRYGVTTILGAVHGGLRERAHDARTHAGAEWGGTTMGNEIRQTLATVTTQVRRSPGFTLVAVVTLALGIGITTGVFSVVRGILLRPLPYPESNELVHLTRAGAASLPNISDLGQRMTSFEELGGAFVPSAVTLTGAGDPVQIRQSFVTPNFFRILALSPVVGRWLDDADVGTSRVVLSHRIWRTRFAGDPGIVGRTVTLDESAAEVVGVAPAEVGPPFDADVWAALPWGPGEGARGARGWRAVEPYGRLADGRTLDDARRELDAEWARLQETYPDDDGRWSVGLESVKAQVTANDETPLKLLFGASALFLLIACANVGSLCLARLESRRREFAVRSSLGAGRMRLLQQAWTETLGLSVIGGALGVGLAALGVRMAMAWFHSDLSRADQVGMDGGVLAFAALTTLGTAGVVGALTVVAWGTEEPAQALRRLGTAVVGRTGFLRRSLVVVEVAMALMMVTGLGLLVRSFEKVQEIDVGVRTEGVVTARLGRFPDSRYPDGDSRRALLDQIQERLGAVPGVQAVAVSSHLPLGGCCSNRPFHLTANPDRRVDGVEVRWVTPGYFRLLDIPILAGKSFRDLGPDDPDAVVINQTMANALFGDQDPIGASIESDGFGAAQVLAVSGSVREFSPRQAPPPMVYVSTSQSSLSGGFLLLRTTLPSERIVPGVRAALGEIDALLPLDQIRPLDDVLAGYSADMRATTFLMTLLGVMALGLGVVGIYGVMSHAVQGQVREIGVRLALGATRDGVLRRVLKGAVVLVLPGVALGAVGALATRRFIDSMLYDVSSLDPAVYVGVVVVFIGAALAAALVPATRAARVDVIEILKDA